MAGRCLNLPHVESIGRLSPMHAKATTQVALIFVQSLPTSLREEIEL